MHGYESVVGPVKGIYYQGVGQIKPRGHTLLADGRPNYVTILALGKNNTFYRVFSFDNFKECVVSVNTLIAGHYLCKI